MQYIQATIRTMTWQEAEQYGYLNRGKMLDYNCISYRLSSGTSDDIHVFRSGVTLYVLTINYKMDYIGLDAYMGKEQEALDSIFLQGEWSIKECIGNDWRDLSLTSLVTRLISLFD